MKPVTAVQIERVLPTNGPDLDGILEVEEASFTNPWTRAMFQGELRNPDISYIYVARISGYCVAAYAAFWRVFDEIHINNLAVRPDCRRQGLASALLKRLLDDGRRLGGRRATLEVRRSNDAALRLYERFGFRLAGTRPNYYSSPAEDALILWRDNLDS